LLGKPKANLVDHAPMGVPLRVLIVEDSADDAALLLRHLKRGGFEPVWERVDTPDGLRTALDADQWELVLCDYSMPRMNGLSALQLVKAKRPELPFIQVSGTVGESVAVEVMKAGAQDYLLKDSLTRLVPAVQRELRDAETRRTARAAEAAKRTSEERFRVLVDGVRDYAIYMLDPEGRVVSWNSGAARITGYRAEEVLGAHHELFYPAENRGRKEPAEHLRLSLQSERFEDQGWRLRKDGSTYFANIVITALRDERGNPQGFAKVIQDVTEQRRAEEKLRLSESLLAEAQQIAHIGSWSWNLLDGTVRWSDEHYRILGLVPQLTAPSYEQFRRLLHPDDLAVLEELVGRALKDGKPYECLLRLPQRDGAVRFASSRGQAVLNEAGEPQRMFGTLQDVTERTRAEEAMRASDERFRMIARATNDAIWDWDLVTNVVWWSESFQTLFGYRADQVEAEAESWYSRLHPGDHERVSSKIGKTIEGGATHWSDEYRFRRGDGNYAYVLDRGYIIRDQQGRPTRMIGAMMDVSKDKQAQRAITQSEARKAAILESGLDCIITMDHEGRVTEFNPAAERTFGYQREEVMGKELTELIVPPAYREQHRLGVKSYAHAGNARILGKRIEVTAMRADGTVFPAELAITRIGIDGPPEFSAYLRDITQRKEAEREISAARADLEARVEQRTSELARANDALQQEVAERKRAEIESEQAKAVAEAASRSKSEFLANMSHEIRTPLNGVIGMADLLLGTDLADRQRRYAEIVRSSGESLLGLINDILDFSKIEAGKLEISSADFDLCACAEEVVQMLAPRALSKGLELACHVHPTLPRVLRGDADRVRQVLVNLVGNAIKFTNNGSVVVRMTVADVKDRALTVRVAVSDTGVGIPASELERLFKSFSQVDTSPTRRHGGTGLGLAISKQLAELMGGTVGVESELGRGSTFWFTVRMEQPQEPALLPTWPFDPRGIRVLAVDDSALQREMFAHQFSTWGFEQATAANGDSAISILNESIAHTRPFKLAVLDADMPGGMGAVKLAQMIRSNRQFDEVTLILLSSMDREVDAATVQRAGFAGQIAKPFRQSQLYDIIVNVLSASKSQSGIVPDASRSVGMPTNAAPVRRLRVLLAEDNRVNQLVAAEILSGAGHQCDVVDTGTKAVQAVAQARYDIVLMDCQMPEMDGFEATRAIRRSEAATGAQAVHIVALTANAINGDREKCIAAGMNDYLSKPVDPKRLIAILNDVAGKEPTTAGPPLQIARESAPLEGAPPSAATPVPPFDTQMLLQRCLGNLSVAEMILEEFEKQAVGDVRHIEMLVDAGDAHRVAQVAHSLKGAAVVLSADSLRDVIAELEQMARAVDWAGVRGRLPQLKSEAERCVRFLPVSRQALAGHSDGGPLASE
jgi:PAS domain S-box-containing protein